MLAEGVDVEDILFLAHVGVTLYLVGLIWTIQIVHYPLFENVGRKDSTEYQRRHMSRITWVVAPPMIVELVTAVYFVVVGYGNLPSFGFWAGLGMVLLVWISTLVIQTPVHGKLSRGYEKRLVKKLVAGNWFRTILWSFRGILVLWMVGQSLAS